MLSAGASEADRKICESAFQIVHDVRIHNFVNRLQEACYFATFFEEVYDRLVESGQLVLFVVSARIVHAAAVEHLSSAVSAVVARYAFLEREAIDGDG